LPNENSANCLGEDFSREGGPMILDHAFRDSFCRFEDVDYLGCYRLSLPSSKMSWLVYMDIELFINEFDY
jgi:hypothetical protein